MSETIGCALCTGKQPRRATVGLVCGVCRDRLDEHLADIRDLYGTLPTFLAPSAGNEKGAAGKRDFGPPPLRIDVLNLLGRSCPADASTEPRTGPLPTGDVLGGWLRMVWEERSYAARDVPDVAGMVDQLRRLLGWVCGRGWVDEFAADMKGARRALQNACGVHRAQPVGTCRHVGPDGVECGTALFAEAFTDEITCRGCGDRWPRSRWLLLGAIQEQEAS